MGPEYLGSAFISLMKWHLFVCLLNKYIMLSTVYLGLYMS